MFGVLACAPKSDDPATAPVTARKSRRVMKQAMLSDPHPLIAELVDQPDFAFLVSGTHGFLSKGMIRGNVFTVPDLSGTPGLRRAAPERVRPWQAKGEECSRAEIEAAGRDVVFTHRRLMATEPYC